MKADVAMFLTLLLQRVPATRDALSDSVSRAEELRAHMMAQDRERFLALVKRYTEDTGNDIADPDKVREYVLSGKMVFKPTNAF